MPSPQWVNPGAHVLALARSVEAAVPDAQIATSPEGGHCAAGRCVNLMRGARRESAGSAVSFGRSEVTQVR